MVYSVKTENVESRFVYRKKSSVSGFLGRRKIGLVAKGKIWTQLHDRDFRETYTHKTVR